MSFLVSSAKANKDGIFQNAVKCSKKIEYLEVMMLKPTPFLGK